MGTAATSPGDDAGPPPPRFLSLPSLAALAACGAWQALPMPWPVNRFDTGIHLTAADLILAGRVPCADFHVLYPPGLPTLVAGAFALFGRSFDTYAVVEIALQALQPWMAWHVARRLSGGNGFLGGLPALAAGCSFLYPYPALVLALAAVLAASRPSGRSPWRRAALGGVLAGAAGWFRQDLGVVGAAAAALAVVTSRVDDTLGRRAAYALAAFGSAAAAITLLLLPSLLRSPAEVFDGLVLRPVATVPWRSHGTNLTEVVGGDVVFLGVAVAGVLFVALGAAAAVAPRATAAVLAPGTNVAILAGCGVVAAWALRYLALRAETHHLIPLALLAGVAASLRPGGTRTARIVVGAAVAAGLLGIGVAGWRSGGARVSETLGRRPVKNDTMEGVVPGASRLYVPPGGRDEYVLLLASIRALAPDGAPFLSACTRHDLVHRQDLLLYFLADTLPPVRDYHFDPGVTTREDVQRRIVEDAERAGVRLVVRWDVRPPEPPPGTPPGSGFLDRWLAAEFRPAATVGRYQLWKR